MISSIQSVCLLLFFIPITVLSQLKERRFEIGTGIGISIYQGDLTPNRFGSFKNMRPAVAIHAGKIMNASFMLRGSLLVAGLHGDETKYNNPEYRKQRAFAFRTPLAELSAAIYFNPLGSNNAGKGFAPFILAGAGISVLRIKKDFSNFNATYFGDGSDIPARIEADNQQRLPGSIPVIPLGAGVRYNLSDSWALQAETSYRLVFTDYLDGFSQAVNPGKNDHYHTTLVSLIYRTGNGNKNSCPAVKY